jgi:hypothetical protein
MLFHESLVAIVTQAPKTNVLFKAPSRAFENLAREVTLACCAPSAKTLDLQQPRFFMVTCHLTTTSRLTISRLHKADSSPTSHHTTKKTA